MLAFAFQPLQKKKKISTTTCNTDVQVPNTSVLYGLYPLMEGEVY